MQQQHPFSNERRCSDSLLVRTTAIAIEAQAGVADEDTTGEVALPDRWGIMVVTKSAAMTDVVMAGAITGGIRIFSEASDARCGEKGRSDGSECD